MPQALRERTVSEDAWRMPVTRLTWRTAPLAGRGWRVVIGKGLTDVNRQPTNQQNQIAFVHDDVNLTVVLLEHAGGLLSESPAVF